MRERGVRIEGLRELDQALSQLPKATAKNVLVRVGKKALGPMADKARELAPDDPATGAPDLHRSIEVSTRQKGGRSLQEFKGPDTATVFMGPTKDGYPQAMPQEFGTPHHPPAAYMRRSWDSEAQGALDSVKDDLADEIQKSADRVARKRARQAARR